MPAADQVPDCSATAVPRARSEAHEASPRRTPLRSRRGLLHRLVLRAPRSPYVVLESGRPINAGRGARLRACVGWSLRRFGLGLAAIVIDLLSKLLGAFPPSGSVAHGDKVECTSNPDWEGPLSSKIEQDPPHVERIETRRKDVEMGSRTAVCVRKNQDTY